MKRNKNGITLIALIITIIVMLILVGVTVNLSANGELFAKARTASADTEKHKILEELIQNANFNNEGKIKVEELIGKAENKYGEGNIKYDNSIGKLTITGNKGKYEYKVTDTEIDLWKELLLTELEKYILGADGKGRILYKYDEEGNQVDGIFNNDEKSFINPPQGLEYLTEIEVWDNPKILYAKYDNKVYKIAVNEDTNKSEELELIYEPKGKEGEKTEDGWTIIYDNGETLEAVSPTAMGELTLGYTNREYEVEQSMKSYNNAIKLINECCNSLENLPTNIKIRSVGASEETDDEDSNNYYTSANLEKLASDYIGKCKKGDTSYEQDLVRMAYWNVAYLGKTYWVASRITEENDEGVNFCVITASSDEECTCISDEVVWWICWCWTDENCQPEGDRISLPVRPIITIENI